MVPLGETCRAGRPCHDPAEEEQPLEFLARLEETPLSIWLRESGVAFFGVLTLHSLAMAFVVGINIALACLLLGWMPRLRLSQFAGFMPLHWIAAALVLISGLGLLLAYPAKALTNPVFYLKLCALGLALTLARGVQLSLTRPALGALIDRRGKQLAVCSLVLWAVTISAGRFLAYTNTVLLASRFY